MYRKLIVLIIASFFSSYLNAQENSLYYYGYKTKYVLTTDSSHSVLIPKDERLIKDISDLPESVRNLKNLTSIVNRKEFLVEISDKSIIKNQDIKDFDVIPIMFHKENLMIPTGLINLLPKEGSKIDDISAVTDYKFTIVKKNDYGSLMIKPDNVSDLFLLSNQIYESGLVEWCEPDFLVSIVKHQSVTPTDPLFPQQYYLNQPNNIDINAPQAWAISRGVQPVRVAVIDDGVEAHEDLAGRVVPGFTSPNNNGGGAPVNNPPPGVVLGHGQACAGILGATHDNVGISGVFPGSTIVPINIFTNWIFNPFTGLFQSVITFENAAAAINWAFNPNGGNADVISNSWGFAGTDFPNSGPVINAINNAQNNGRVRNGVALGVPVIFSSGNFHPTPGCGFPDCFNGVAFPANVNGVITVGAIDRNGAIWNYSSRGPQMDLVAPTGNVNNLGDLVTTDRMGNLGYNNGNYTFTFGGTSGAAPQVAGAAALMISVNPNLTLTQIRNILRNTATDMGPSGFDNTFGYGRLNLEAALKASLPTIIGNSLLCTSNNNYTPSFAIPNTTASWQVTPPGFFATGGGAATSGNGTTATLRAASNFGGQATIEFTFTGPLGQANVRRNIWVGTPHITNMRVNNQPVFPSQSVSLCPGNHWLNVTPVGGNAGAATWTVPQGVPHWIGNNTMDFTFPSNMSSITISARSSNSCGQGVNYNFFLMRQNWNCPSSFAVVAYPNPTSDVLNIEMIPLSHDVSKDDAPIIYSAILLNSDGREVSKGFREGSKIVFDVSHLKRGVYFIHVIVDGEMIREQIVIE
ncbi:S8 family serine peptidase [Mongoliitalea lutea]|uniref:Por secretion system C-terminal sorting domain-containing protein n=1 Tax=Mongoliitalea lutea TaxID=849756 RepID=A0A8J3G7V9_9BACT|nr:S8 family serine peptidase [Mongoliitalea lutea]GHB53843.1 hypothetical protein GCM10008106_37680 [Mongoliitalea lutea]